MFSDLRLAGCYYNLFDRRSGKEKALKILIFQGSWCARRESNPRPSHSECATLSPELLAQTDIIYLYHKSIRLERVFYSKPGEPDSSEGRTLFLQETKVIFVILYQTVFFHAAQLSRHGASVHTEKISEFLTVKGNVKAAVFRYLSMI